MALRNYHDANGCFPPAFIADKNGKPMLSWRVLILPYMEQHALYKLYKFNEPWDGPNNKKLSAIALKEYVCPSDPTANTPNANRTNYVAVLGPNAAWLGDKPRKLDEFAGKEADTIMVVEVADSGIAWAEPRDISLGALATAKSGASVLMPSSHHCPQSDFFYIYDSFSCAGGDGRWSCGISTAR